MLGGKACIRGSSVLVSGSPGTGKSSISAHFVDAACRRGERAVIFAYEESAAQILRNMRSIGLDLEPWMKKGLLQIRSSRPTLQGLEQHLVVVHDVVRELEPSVVVVDPINNLSLDHSEAMLKPTLMRLIDFLKQSQITALFTSATSVEGSSLPDDAEIGVSSLMDTWLLLRNVELNGERNRTLYVLKSRGMTHSNQVREFVLSDTGIDLVDVYLGADRVLTGTARVAQVARESAAAELRKQQHERRMRLSEGKRRSLEAQIELLRAQADSEAAEERFAAAEAALQDSISRQTTETIANLRGTDGESTK